MKRIQIRLLAASIVLGLASTTALALELNTASVEQLTQSGFSLEQAQRIVTYRQENGLFKSTQDVLKVPGITQGQLMQEREQLTIAGNPVTTPSGTAPAIPGVRPAIPGSKIGVPAAAPADDGKDKAKGNSNKGNDKGKGNSGGDKGGGNGKGNGRDK